jgi:hypothetical protein
LNTTDEQFTMIVNESVAVVNKAFDEIDETIETGTYLRISYDY